MENNEELTEQEKKEIDGFAKKLTKDHPLTDKQIIFLNVLRDFVFSVAPYILDSPKDIQEVLVVFTKSNEEVMRKM